MVATKYETAFNELAFNIMRVYGSTDKKLALFLGIAEGTLYDWKIRHPEFAQRVQDGKDEFDSERVEKALLDIALGYEHDDVHISNYQGEITVTPITKHYPPNFAAIKHWQMNRARHRWDRDQAVEHSGGIKITRDEEEL